MYPVFMFWAYNICIYLYIYIYKYNMYYNNMERSWFSSGALDAPGHQQLLGKVQREVWDWVPEFTESLIWWIHPGPTFLVVEDGFWLEAQHRQVENPFKSHWQGCSHGNEQGLFHVIWRWISSPEKNVSCSMAWEVYIRYQIPLHSTQYITKYIHIFYGPFVAQNFK